MRFLPEFILLSISITFIQGQLVIPKIDNLNAIISLSQVERWLSTDKVQELQNRVFNTVIVGLSNQWNVTTLAEVLEHLVREYVPQISEMLIDWDAVSQTAMNDVSTNLPKIVLDTIDGVFNKRDLSAQELQFLSQLPPETLVQIVEIVNIPDRTTALTKLRQLIKQLFPSSQGRNDFDDLAESLLDRLNDLLPHFSPQPPHIQG